MASLSGATAPGEVLSNEDIILRPERPKDNGFLAALFRSIALPELTEMPVTEAVKDALVQMQFASQTATYRAQFPMACFDIIEQRDKPIGRLVIDPGGEAGCIVDMALLPECRGLGLGSTILAHVLERFAKLQRPVLCKVLAHNEASLRMCRRAGFRQIDYIPPFLQLQWSPA